MSTGHMPNQPDQPTAQAGRGDTAPQATAPAEPQSTGLAAPLPLGADMARIIEEQAEIIVQRQVYHSQMMLGVSAVGTDSVNARTAALTVANALRHGADGIVAYALVNLGDPQISQINDHTLPFNFNAQVAGLFEGILLDTISQAYKADPARRKEARDMLQRIFMEANAEAEKQSKAMLAFLAPGPHPNARK
jgi:hypothetical protein